MLNLLADLAPRYAHIDFTPTEQMAAEAEQGLAWWRTHDGRGGHEMALARAWRIRRRSPLSPDRIRRMAAHMTKLQARKAAPGWHESDREHPSASRITWALMGGDSGFGWARAVVEQLDAADAVLTANQRRGELAVQALTERQAGGRRYLVAPVVALVPGVVNGFLVTADELQRSAGAWNGRPVTLRHPQADGRFVSADDPAAADQRIGTLHGAAFTDGRLKGELWLDPELCAAAGPDAVALLARMQAGGRVEVSTGYFCQVLDHAGVYDGAPFDGEQVGIVPDHLAVLPDEGGRVLVGRRLRRAARQCG